MTIDSIKKEFKIGAMSLKIKNLIGNLKAWILLWKDEFADDLHKKA